MLFSHPNIFSISLIQDNEIENEIEQKSIRSPSMRLRFGRRNDPLMSLYNEVQELSHILTHV